VLERSLLHTPEQDHWLALDRSWLSGGAEGSDSAGRAGVLAEGTSMVRALEGGSPTDLTPVELQEFELYKRVLIEERGAIRRTAARLGVSHQVVLRRLHRWPQLRELARSRETPV
jgi:hypothetical protein